VPLFHYFVASLLRLYAALPITLKLVSDARETLNYLTRPYSFVAVIARALPGCNIRIIQNVLPSERIGSHNVLYEPY
jgi:hypothetical protein